MLGEHLRVTGRLGVDQGAEAEWPAGDLQVGGLVAGDLDVDAGGGPALVVLPRRVQEPGTPPKRRRPGRPLSAESVGDFRHQRRRAAFGLVQPASSSQDAGTIGASLPAPDRYCRRPQQPIAVIEYLRETSEPPMF